MRMSWVLLCAALTACGGAAGEDDKRGDTASDASGDTDPVDTVEEPKDPEPDTDETDLETDVPPPPPPPTVQSFSPFVSPIDFGSKQQNPTFTNAALTVSVAADAQGVLRIVFDPAVPVDRASFFLGGNEFLGPDPEALQVARVVLQTGLVPLPITAVVESSPNVFDLTVGPPAFPMVDGGYRIRLGAGLKSKDGAALAEPVFHSFVVGASDTVAPAVVTSFPNAGDTDVPAGADSPDIVIQMTESIAASSVGSATFTVTDESTGKAVPGAAGHPVLRSFVQGTTLPSNAHELVWSPHPNLGGFPAGTTIRVTVNGLEDTSGTSMLGLYSFTFDTAP